MSPDALCRSASSAPPWDSAQRAANSGGKGLFEDMSECRPSFVQGVDSLGQGFFDNPSNADRGGKLIHCQRNQRDLRGGPNRGGTYLLYPEESSLGR